MGTTLETLTAEFKIKYEKFQIGCDALEELELWDKEKLGEMDVYYQNELVSIILKLIVADGSIGKREAEFFDKNFGFECSVEDLQEIYNQCHEMIDNYFDENFANGISKMRSMNPRLADYYKELLLLICDIIINSDGVVSEQEKKEIDRIKSSV